MWLKVKKITHRSSNSIAFRVKHSSNLSEVAIAMDVIIQHGRFHQESVVAFQHSFHSLVVAVHKNGRFFVLHKTPHFLVSFNFRILNQKERNISDYSRAYFCWINIKRKRKQKLNIIVVAKLYFLLIKHKRELNFNVIYRSITGFLLKQKRE